MDKKGSVILFLEQKSGDCLTKKNGEKNNNQLISQKPFFFPKHLFARMEPISLFIIKTILFRFKNIKNTNTLYF